MARPLARRHFLGYVGSAAAGAAAGAGGAVAWGEDARVGQSAPAAVRTISPYGHHQPGVVQPVPPVLELVGLDLDQELVRTRDTEALARLLRVWTGSIEALTAGRPAPGDTTPWLATAGRDLTLTIGLGPRVLGDGWGVSSPSGFGEIPAMRHDRLRDEWSGGDLLVMVAGTEGTTVGHAVRRMVADAAPFAALRWRQQGSWNGADARGHPVTGRNLFGQVDGSGNPAVGTALFERTVWVPDGLWAGGTTMALRWIRMDLPTWDELTGFEQEGAVGRTLSDGAPLTGGAERDDLDLAARRGGRLVIAQDAHARRSHPTVNDGRRIFRKGANYEVGPPQEPETGLLFSSFQADLGDFIAIQRSLDDSDALNEWTTAVGSASFAVLPGFTEGGFLGESVLAADVRAGPPPSRPGR